MQRAILELDQPMHDRLGMYQNIDLGWRQRNR